VLSQPFWHSFPLPVSGEFADLNYEPARPPLLLFSYYDQCGFSLIDGSKSQQYLRDHSRHRERKTRAKAL